MTDHVTDRSLLSGRVRRYACWPVIREQTVGDHTWGVYHVYWRIFGLPSAQVALYIHLHDAEELVIGDNPYPSKSRFPALKAATTEAERVTQDQLNLPHPEDYCEVSEEARACVKVCDLLEMMQFGMQEREMGNLLATSIVERTREAASAHAQQHLPEEAQRRVIDWIHRETIRHFRTIEQEGSTR